MKPLIEYTTWYQVGDTYFKADHFTQHSHHDNIQVRRAYRQDAANRAGIDMDNQVVPVHECELSMYKRPQPRTLSQLDPDLVAGSSGSLSRSSLSTLPSKDTDSLWQEMRLSIPTPLVVTTQTSVKPIAHTNAESHAVQ